MDKRKYLTEPEIDAFLKAAKTTTHGKRDFCLALMAYRHGLRVSELVGARLDQVDLMNSTFQPCRLKDGTNTLQPIEGDELRAIRAWLRERTTNAYAGSPYLFLSERGPMTRQAVNYLFDVIGKKAEIKIKVHPHMLRHACGYTLANKNIATKTIQDYLGHRNIKHTEIYTSRNPARFKGIWSK